VANVETNKPWGGFIVIDDESTKQFIDTYFLSQNTDQKDKLSPKILVVEPDKRLSWQYHFRRGELWRVIKGPVGYMSSPVNLPFLRTPYL